MKKTPAGWPRITPSLYYEKPQAAIDWLCRVFGFQVRIKVDGENDRIVHAELSFGDDGLVMVGTAGGDGDASRSYQGTHASPVALGKNTQGLAVFVDDVDAHYAKAKAAGAEIFRQLETNDYGEAYWSDRTYGVLDLEKHQWFFMQRMRDPKTT